MLLQHKHLESVIDIWVLEGAAPRETRLPKSLPPTIGFKDLVCKVWSPADYKPIVQRRKECLPHPAFHHFSYKATGPPPTGVGAPQRQEGRKGEKSVWFSWRLHNGEASASSLRCPRQVEGLQQGSVNHGASARDRQGIWSSRVCNEK